MKPPRKHFLLWPAALRRAVLACAACVPACGCENPRASVDRYLPSEPIAREAVASVLEAWRNDRTPANLKNGSLSIQVADTHRQPGQILAGYEILGAAPADGGRRFAVRLQLENPEAVEKIHFVVVGIDPLWVFRQEDYDMIAHWEHPMPTDGPPAEENDPEAVEADLPREAVGMEGQSAP
jgi:hypothetical protein